MEPIARLRIPLVVEMTSELEMNDLDKRLSELERRHRTTREWLLGLVSIVVAIATVVLLNVERGALWASESVVVRLFELIVVYAVIKRVTRWAMR